MKLKREDVWTVRYLVYQGTLTNKTSSDEAMPETGALGNRSPGFTPGGNSSGTPQPRA